MSDGHNAREGHFPVSSSSTADSSTLPTDSQENEQHHASSQLTDPQIYIRNTDADEALDSTRGGPTHTAPTNASISTALPNENADPAGPSTAAAARRTGRVHWDGTSNAASFRKGGQLQIRAGGALAGPTVTVRGGAAPPQTQNGNSLSLGSVRRNHHPGPLNIAERLTPQAEAPTSISPPHVEIPAAAAAAAAAETQIPSLSLTGAKGLDEQGLDNRAFLELQRELQRHEARSEDGASAVSWQEATEPPQDRAGRDRLEQVFMDRERDREARRQRQRAAAGPNGAETPAIYGDISGVATPGTATSESSYDPANDSDLDHVDLIPGEIDGMPTRIKKPKRDEEADQQPKGWAKLRGLFGKPPTDEEDQEEKGQAGQSARPEIDGSHDQNGPTNWKSVPVETSSGLHTGDGPRRRPNKFEREAARLVKQHKLAQQRQDALDRIDRSHLPASGASTPDAMDTSMNMDARPVASGGVLGNLLRLYEQQQRDLAKSAATSSVGSVSEYNLDGEVRPSGTGTPEAVRKTLESSSFQKNVERYEKRRNMSLHSISLPSPKLTQTFAKVGIVAFSTSTKVVRGVANETGIEGALDERPKASRSGAGVFGALVATTGNLVGAVSPQHAQLGPNPKRPGFSLDRYLLPEMNAKTLKRTAQIVADAAPAPYRPNNVSPLASRSHSLPTSPDGDQEHRDSSTQANSPTASGYVTPARKRPSSIMHLPSRTVTGGSSVDGSGPRKRHLHLPGAMTRAWTHSNINTPDVNAGMGPDYFGPEAEKAHSDWHKQEWQRKLKKRAKDKRRKEEIFITMHVAAILQRQQFIMKLARALMMFGAPTHRIETQIQQTGRVLEINCRCIYLPNLMLLAFGDDATHTSETKFIKQTSGLDLTKLTDMHTIYWNVIHDKIGVEEASAQLDELMRRKPLIGRWPMVLIGGFASAFICVGPQGFNGSFIDAVMAFPLGAFLVYCQSIITTELYSNVFEIVFATLNSFVAAAVQSTGYFCYAAVVSGSIVLILPGFIVLSGSLELQSKNLIAGSVRLVYAIIYSLFLGFGISIGVSFWQLFSGNIDTSGFNDCSNRHTAQWWRSDVSEVWAVLTAPAYSICLSLRNQAKITRKEFPVMVLIACGGWACNHFAAKAAALSRRQDVTAALGSLAVGIMANIYGRIFDGRSFVVSVPGILYQLPSGLSNGGGLLNFASNQDSSSAFASGFTVAQSLVEVALGLTVGLFASTVLSYLLGGRKVRNGGGLFSF
ncbi:related to PRM10 - Pheromone-regulated protein, proposed to be involved in mating [Melanopsichium pennsylvanicum]|uniref:Related to PRM10 - Pheromone-regulated protein, proposed to be involved in mating n=2 Tax=Melanopsichium pennsylvanicum TaxID=63383 RepID=A0AAJ5C7H9_9BASI|nr:conserved hypothetical protein [Melanopsichium pennsylvanicum 4]SNX86927.1 related to PRM10 - Pheromone-regulated protein, proposed to be involved in mating [Melanopsichium pennsylvanicum]